jgi:hypothetical protein
MLLQEEIIWHDSTINVINPTIFFDLNQKLTTFDFQNMWNMEKRHAISLT